MLKAFKYRLYPTAKQAELIDKHIGACRFVYNLALETKNYAYATHGKRLSCFDLHAQLPELKKECLWLTEISAQSLQQSITDLDSAFTSFFKGRSLFPRFKKKTKGSSFRIQQYISVEKNKIYIPKFREGIKLIMERKFLGDIKFATVSKSSADKYFVSLVCETREPVPTKPNPTEGIGVDMGLTSYITTSNGVKIGNPRHLKKSLDRLKILQRRASRKKKGSANRKKANHRVALLHERVANQRKDFLHKLSSKLVSENQTLCFEDLNVKSMQQSVLARPISDAGWYFFKEIVKYKCDWYGKNFLIISRFEPSTILCSCCGYINRELTLKDREWDCPKCKTHHDRDVNAAINIRNYCLKNSGRGTAVEPSELPTLVGALKKEVNL